MKKLDVSSITDSSEFPLKKGTLQFLQDAYSENLAALLIGIIGNTYNPGTVYILYGCTNSLTVPAYNIAPGAIFYNGEVFYVDGATFTVSGGNVGIFSIVVSQYTVDADPVTFTDTVVRNVHNIRKIQVSQGASGTGLADYSAGAFLNLRILPQLNLSAPVTPSAFSDNVAQVFGTYPNINIYVPAPASNTNPIVASGSKNVGDVSPGGGTTSVITFGSALADSNYFVMGCIRSTGVATNDALLANWVVIDGSQTVNGFSIHFQEVSGVVQAIIFDYICFHK